MFDDSGNKCFVFFTSVLFVEDAVLFVAETDASEKVGGTEYVLRVINIPRVSIYIKTVE